MPNFRKKPIVIEAEQFSPDKPLPFNDRGPYVCFSYGRWYVMTAHAQTVNLVAGDWVILEPVGSGVPPFSAYPCKPDIFEKTYEPVRHLAMVCGVDCHPGNAICNNYCNSASEKGPMAAFPPPGPDAT